MSYQFSSLGNMEILEYSQNKHFSKAEPPVTMRSVCKHDSAYSSFTSSSHERSLSRSTDASTECVFYCNNGEHQRYLQVPVNNHGPVSPKLGPKESSSSRFSTPGKANVNKFITNNVSEKSSAAPSPPPPSPPLRSDSFAATKVHEKGFVMLHPQGAPAYSHQKCYKQFDGYFNTEHGSKSLSYSLPATNDFLRVHSPADYYNPNQLNPKKVFSLSTTDVRQSLNPFASQPESQHQRQHSDESPFYFQHSSAVAPKTQRVSSTYQSMQNLPCNVDLQNPSFKSSSTAIDNSSYGIGHFRYYCITAQQPGQDISEGVGEDRRMSKSKSDTASDCNLKPKKHSYSPSTKSFPIPVKSNPEHRQKHNRCMKDEGIAQNQHGKSVLNRAEKTAFSTTTYQDTQTQSLKLKNEPLICPFKTPLLHCLAQESKFLADSTPIPSKTGFEQEMPEPVNNKPGRRSDRYATTLRHEIQEITAQLQKSRSAATLTGTNEIEDDLVWKSTETSSSSSDGSFTNTYKDNLKEAQARVLQATSFKRNDLKLPGNQSQLFTKSDSTTNCHISRIGSRKRFNMDRRVHSFSEPDINVVGVKEKTSQAIFDSFMDRCKVSEGASKPTCPKPIQENNSNESIIGKSNILSLDLSQNENQLGNEWASGEEHQRRLGTFAEYQAKWNLQRKSSGVIMSGRYHSAENILDSGLVECSSFVCIHERSRSSPSADFHKVVPIQFDQSENKCEMKNKHTLDLSDAPEDTLNQLVSPSSPKHHLSLPSTSTSPVQSSFPDTILLEEPNIISQSLRPTAGLSEDELREELVRDIMKKDKSLLDILDQKKMITTMDLMEGIYPQPDHLLEGLQQWRKSTSKQSSPRTTQER